MQTNPPVRIEMPDDVVIGPWPEYQGDYTVLHVDDLDTFINDLIELRDGQRVLDSCNESCSHRST